MAAGAQLDHHPEIVVDGDVLAVLPVAVAEHVHGSPTG
jgi:hypothetical protein